MKAELRDLLRNKSEELGWSVRFDDDGEWEISKYSPAGEDFSFCITGKDVVREVYEYYSDFDADEHAAMWIEGRGTRGVPSSIRVLIDDAEAIDAMLKELADAFEDVWRDFPDDDDKDEEDEE